MNDLGDLLALGRVFLAQSVKVVVGPECLGQDVCGFAEVQDVTGKFQLDTVKALWFSERRGGSGSDVVHRHERVRDVGSTATTSRFEVMSANTAMVRRSSP